MWQDELNLKDFHLSKEANEFVLNIIHEKDLINNKLSNRTSALFLLIIQTFIVSILFFPKSIPHTLGLPIFILFLLYIEFKEQVKHKYNR